MAGTEFPAEGRKIFCNETQSESWIHPALYGTRFCLCFCSL